MKRLKHTTGAIEFFSTAQEKEKKEKYKAIKKPSDLKDTDVKELVYELAKRANLL